VNAELSPGVKVAGGVAQHVMNELDISCLPKDLPGFIEIDLSQLQAGHPLHLSGVKLPDGVEAVALSKGEDPTVASVLIPRVATAEEELAAAAATPSAAEVATTKQKAEEAGKEGAAPAGKEGKEGKEKDSKEKDKEKDKGDKK
jgi:large subunit ribosomal protein L25